MRRMGVGMVIPKKLTHLLRFFAIALVCAMLASIHTVRSAEPPPVSSTDVSNYHNVNWNPTVNDGRKHIYLFSTDFPSDPLAQYPSPPAEETQFWRLLDKDMAATNALSLTADPAQADYRVELRCGGIFRCSRLRVDVKTPQRQMLTSFSLKNVNNFWGLGAARLDQVSRELSLRLDEHIRALPQGGQGHSD
jgi:hypothetical protein